MQQTNLGDDSGRWSPQMEPPLSTSMSNIFTDSDELDNLLRTLQISAEQEELKTSLLRLSQMYTIVPKHLEQKNVNTAVLSMLNHMEHDKELQMLGLDLLYNFTLNSQSEEFIMHTKHGITGHVMKLLANQTSAYSIKTKALVLLDNLLSSDSLRDQLAAQKQYRKLVEVIMKTVSHCLDNSECLMHAMSALLPILKEDQELRSEMAKQYLQLLQKIFRSHAKDAALVKMLFKVLSALAVDAHLQPLLGLPVLEIIKSQASLRRRDSSVTVESFHVLEMLSVNGNVLEFLVEGDFLVTVVLRELLTHSEDSAVQLSGLKVVMATANLLFPKTKSEEHAFQWLKVVFLAMSRHMGNVNIQILCCKVLAKLVENKQEVCAWIGEDANLRQDPIHTLCLGAILMHEKVPEVFVSACKAIYYLAADNETLCRALMEKNSHIAIFEGLRLHRKDKDVVISACQAIRGLCIFQNDHKQKISHYDGDILNLLVETMNTFALDAEVQCEIISTIACLADVDLVRHQCFVFNVHLYTSEAMDKFAGDEYLQEAALELLSVLGGATSGPELLCTNGAVDKIMMCMKRFVYNGNIQKKGLWAIQILCDSHLVQSTAMCKELADIIKSTMRNHPQSLVIQKEAIVAMQILAERAVDGNEAVDGFEAVGNEFTEHRRQKSNMAEMLVDQECHEILFQILEKYNDDHGLHDLASECLYVIGIEKDLKSRMLLAACSKGYIEGAECLIEVGADVNIGKGMDTPLSLAVKNKNENLVRLLLKQEVRDVQTSLKLSLQHDFHDISGLLLSYIGQDRETGTVLWSSLNLGDLRPEWVLPTLAPGLARGFLTNDNSTHYSNGSASLTSKRFVAKIKDSEQRRHRRLQHGLQQAGLLSDSTSEGLTKWQSAEFLRHRMFRYHTSAGEFSSFTSSLTGANRMRTTLSKKPSTHPRANQRRGRSKFIGRHMRYKSDSDVEFVLGTSPTRPFHICPIVVTTSSSPPAATAAVDPTTFAESLHIDYREPDSPSPDFTDAPVYIPSVDEWEDWKQTTLTGANIPFNPADPRRPSDTATKTADPSVLKNNSRWLRKFRGKEKKQTFRRYSRDDGDSFNSSMESTDNTYSRKASSDLQSTDSEAGFSRAPSPVQSALSADETDLDTSVEDSKGPRDTKSKYAVRNLDLSNNNVSSLNKLIAAGEILQHRFSFLEHIDLSNNNLTELPDRFLKSLTKLVTMSLSHNNFSTFPRGISFCINLVTLDLSSNKIDVLNFGEKDRFLSTSVTDLYLSKNAIKEFPISLEKALPQLTKLDISSNLIRILPDQQWYMPELRYLDFSHNSIHNIPDAFLNECVKLETLVAINNGLDTLPGESVASILTRLGTLKLSNNDITEKEPFYVPRFILELPNVRLVDLSCNGITGFPCPSIWKSSKLKDLMMSHNQITKLHLDGAKHWSKLEKLHLSHNKIAELPREIGYLTSLQSLDLSFNKPLSTLPDELGRCFRLWELPLDGLNLDLDDALLRGRVKDLIIYLHNRLKKARQYYRMKLMIVGYGGRGKTSLLHALKKRIRSNLTEKPPVTVGVIVDEWKYDRQRNNRTITYTLNTWDFAGQEDFYSTHQCFLSNRTLYLVVYDISMGIDEIDKLKPWLSNIHARAPNCPVIVVGTHYDLLPKDDRREIVTEFERKLRELMQKPGFPMITCHAIVDLTKETSELDLLRSKVKDTVDDFKIKGQPVMGQKVPASYVLLGDLLHEEAKNVETSFPVIRHSQLLRLIRSENLDLDEDEELQQAIKFLHESGVLLHYNETALQMRDFYFINPGWLCRMMAQVVTVPQINPFIDGNGIMKRSSASMLFTGKMTSGECKFVFPATLIPQYLHLLEKFEIALPRNKDELLIPSRLPSRGPNIELPVAHRQDLVYRYYVMPYTPIGFWSRLLTRLIVFSESKFTENMLYLLENPFVQFWMEGIYVCWSSDAFFLVSSYKGIHDEIHMTVPNTTHGCRLLGFLVDHADSLVDEWYPGLTAIDPMLGRELLEKFAPCPICTDQQPFSFRFEELLKHSEQNTEIFCPGHEGMVDLAKLAPDVMLADIEPHFHLDLDLFEFKESPENLCGDGGFGSVYKAKYKGKTVAVKVFGAVGDIHPHKMLRQEATILRRLNHPSVIALVAVAVRPARLVVMEFAPSKSLGAVFRSGIHLSRTLQLKICQQIAEGLDYLHSLIIVYRDMKPDNVLVFSLAPDALINAKIADYGISQFTTLFGLTAQEGTPAYRAPEVVRGETYSFQADIFSLGILMYMVLTGGVHPFDELEFKSEIDKAFAENMAIPPITQRGCAPWPDMEKVIAECVSQVPDYRPTAPEVFLHLSHAELFSLREVLPVSVGTTVECVATQSLGSKNVRLWVASGDNEYMQLSWLNLLDYQDNSLQARTKQPLGHNGMGTMFRDGRVLCMLPVSSEHILLGTQAGKIWVFHTASNELVHCTRQLEDSVLSLFLVSSRSDDPLILAGLANGKVALYPTSEILQEPDMKPIEMKLGEGFEPVRCILRSPLDKKLVASCGTKIVIMETRIGVAVENVFDTVDSSGPASPPISSMACGRQLFLAHRNSVLLQSWDMSRGRHKNTLNISNSFHLSRKDGRITAMVLHDTKTLWVGTGGGQIVLVDVNNWTPIIMTHRHTASIRCLLAVRLRGTIKYGPGSNTSVILSGGLGFTTKSGCDTDRENQYGCIGVWDADFPQMVKQMSDWTKKRKDLCQNTRRHTRSIAL